MKQLIHKIKEAIDAGCYDEALRLLDELEKVMGALVTDSEFVEAK